MYPGFVSGGLGIGKTAFVHLIQFQCKHGFYEKLHLIKRSLNFCENNDVHWVCFVLFFCDMENNVFQFPHNLMEVVISTKEATLYQATALLL